MKNQFDSLPLIPLKGTLGTHEAPFRELGVKVSTIKIPNLLLIAGNGRNVGKTTLACNIISYFALKTEVIGLKITPHFHIFDQSEVIFKTEKIIVIEEKKIGPKDSSLMLQAGAKKVYFVMVKQEYLHEAVGHLVNILPNSLIVCESGGLNEWVAPGMFFMVKRKDEVIVKTHLLKHSPIIVNNDGENFDFDIQNIEFENNKFSLKN